MRRLMLILAMLVLLAGCAAAPAAPAVQCRIVLESSPAFTAQTQTAAVTPGQTVTFTLTPADGYTLTGADYPGARLTRTGTGYTLSLPEARYSTAVAVTAEKSDTVLYYRDNLGGDWIEAPVTASHLRVNTAIQGELFNNPGHTLTGWNTAPDGSGQAVGLGSRTAPGRRLYAQWAAQNDAAEFTFTVNNGTATVTGWQGSGERLVLPDTLGGAPVVEIAAGAFTNAACREIILPDTLRRIEPGAFTGCAVESLTLFDNLQTVSDYAFEGCTALRTLHITAATAPVYSGSYYATFADKYDRLLSLSKTRKLVLFSGSSARFGYDSAALDEALPNYAVVNMGVFAYTNALPQLELIRSQLQEGDLLLLSPEFDAAKRQFCTTNAFDDDFFCMVEGNYDLLALLDLRQYSGVFYQRFILGLWTVAEGLVYDMFDRKKHVVDELPELSPKSAYVACDFGTQNATVFLLLQKQADADCWIVTREYYYSGREQKRQKTVGEYVTDLKAWLNGLKPERIIVDPSALPLITELRKNGFTQTPANNDVLSGILDVQTMLQTGRLKIYKDCKHTLEEFGVYAWDPDKDDTVLKVNDHCMDAIRYFVRTKRLVKLRN